MRAPAPCRGSSSRADIFSNTGVTRWRGLGRQASPKTPPFRLSRAAEPEKEFLGGIASLQTSLQSLDELAAEVHQRRRSALVDLDIDNAPDEDRVIAAWVDRVRHALDAGEGAREP